MGDNSDTELSTIDLSPFSISPASDADCTRVETHQSDFHSQPLLQAEHLKKQNEQLKKQNETLKRQIKELKAPVGGGWPLVLLIKGALWLAMDPSVTQGMGLPFWASTM